MIAKFEKPIMVLEEKAAISANLNFIMEYLYFRTSRLLGNDAIVVPWEGM